MNAFAGLYNRRIRGFRVINFAAVIFLMALMFGLYWAKTRASVDGAAIGRIETQIGAQKRDIRMLEARVAGLEQPGRIGQLSEDYLHLAPAKTTQETTPDKLAQISAHPPASGPKTIPAVAVVLATATPAAPATAALTAPGVGR
jgi:hypothetical protein